jgi:YVTN family beta-propeller protein
MVVRFRHLYELDARVQLVRASAKSKTMKTAKEVNFLPEFGVCLASALSALFILSTTPGLAQQLGENSLGPDVKLPKNTVVATIPVGPQPQGVVVSPNSETVYVANIGSASVSVINAATNMVTLTIPVGNSPDGLAITPDGTTLYVANNADNTVSVIATSNNSVTATVAVPERPAGPVVSPDGTQVYVSHPYLPHQYKSTVSIIDTANNQVSTPINFGKYDSITGHFAPDGSDAYFSVSNEYSGRATFPQELYTVDTTSHKVISSVKLAPVRDYKYGYMAISPDGTKLYIDQTNAILVIDTSDNTKAGRISVTGSASVPAVTPNGKYLYVPIYSTSPGTVVMIGTAHKKIIGTPITIGNEPLDVAIAPNGHYAYVSNSADGTVSVIDISPQ